MAIDVLWTLPHVKAKERSHLITMENAVSKIFIVIFFNHSDLSKFQQKIRTKMLML